MSSVTSYIYAQLRGSTSKPALNIIIIFFFWFVFLLYSNKRISLAIIKQQIYLFLWNSMIFKIHKSNRTKSPIQLISKSFNSWAVIVWKIRVLKAHGTEVNNRDCTSRSRHFDQTFQSSPGTSCSMTKGQYFGQQRGILLRMRQENLFGAFGAILIFSARFCGFSTERSTPFCDIFWRGMEEYDKFTTISNSVDTCGVCWLFG